MEVWIESVFSVRTVATLKPGMRLVPIIASLALAILPAAGMAQPVSSPSSTFHEVTYLEVKPSHVAKALLHLKQQLHSLRQSRAGLNLVLLQEIDRPNQYVLLSDDRERYSQGGETLGYSVELDLADYRILPDFVLESIPLINSRELSIPLGGFVMVAHLDADPTQRDLTLPQLKGILSLVPELSGNRGVQVLTWRKRTNHWTLIESWSTRQNFYSSLEDPRMQALRAAIASHAAAPSDLRLYRRID